MAVQSADGEWEQLLEYLTPIKAFHKERIRRQVHCTVRACSLSALPCFPLLIFGARTRAQLKRVTGNATGDDPAESFRGPSGPSYWAQLSV